MGTDAIGVLGFYVGMIIMERNGRIWSSDLGG